MNYPTLPHTCMYTVCVCVCVCVCVRAWLSPFGSRIPKERSRGRVVNGASRCSLPANLPQSHSDSRPVAGEGLRRKCFVHGFGSQGDSNWLKRCAIRNKNRIANEMPVLKIMLRTLAPESSRRSTDWRRDLRGVKIFVVLQNP